MSTLFATSAMRAAVLDEAELAGLPARVQAIARSLALNQHVRGTCLHRRAAPPGQMLMVGRTQGPRTQSNDEYEALRENGTIAAGELAATAMVARSILRAMA
jgi:hypothetical protein